jgi:carboxypeptidase C (cathepsin A)
MNIDEHGFKMQSQWGRRFRLISYLYLSAFICVSTSSAQTRPATSRPTAGETGDHLSVTEHSIQFNGKPLKYRATAGTMLIKDEKGKPQANFFFVAYQRQPEETPANRPITYVFNGGPGAASVWLQLGAAGPERIVTNADGTLPPPPYKLADNQSTWLDTTDLVFIDPVGTGFSRAADDQKPSEFFGLHQDVESVGDFIRLYATRYGRWTSPTFIAGESYGTTRGAALSNYLLDRYGMELNGLVLVSSVLNFETIDTSPGNDLAYALYLPSYTLIALYHNKLKPADFPGPDGKPMARQQIIQTVRDFAIHEYLPMLAEGQMSVSQKQQLADKLAHFTSLPANLIARADDRVDPMLFEKNLLADEHKIVGRFDARQIAYDLNPASDYPEFDPSLSSFFSAYSSTFSEYARKDLEYKSDLPYEVLTSVQPWSFGGTAGTGYLNVTGDLRSAMAKNPHMKVLFANGYYDLATPFMTADYTIDHLNLSPELRANIQHVYFDAGHMVYQVPAAAKGLHEDIAQFIHNAIPNPQ